MIDISYRSAHTLAISTATVMLLDIKLRYDIHDISIIDRHGYTHALYTELCTRTGRWSFTAL